MIETYIIAGVVMVFGAVAARSALTVLWRRVFRPKVKGHMGESKVAKVLKRFNRKGAHSKNDILIKHDKGTSQIDHLLITKQGIVVIETKNYSGTIYGSEHGKLWTQQIPGSYAEPRRFYNPIRQNEGHIRALTEILKGENNIPFHSLVVFTGDAAYPQLPGVISARELEPAIKILTSGTPVLSDDQMKRIRSKIEDCMLTNQKDREKHNLLAGMNASADPAEVQDLINKSLRESVYVEFAKPQPKLELTPTQQKRQLLTDTHAELTIRGKTDTIEGFFEKAKRREDGQEVPLGGSFDYFICPYTGDRFPAAEALNLYQGLWITYLNKNQELVTFLNETGPENLGNTFRCKKVLSLYSKDKDNFIRQVRSTPWYQNMVNKQRKRPPIDNKIQSAKNRTPEQKTDNTTKSMDGR